MSATRGPGRVRELAGGSAALLALILVVGVPLGLATAVGWPLPHQIPTEAGLRTALTTRGIPDRTIVDALACVAWLAWLSAVLSIAEEAVAAIRGRRARRLPLAGAFQPMASRLVAAVLFAALSIARPQPATTYAPQAPLALQLRPGTANLTAALVGVAVQPSPVQATAPIYPTAVAGPPTYTVVRNDTLWSIAQRELGNPLRWPEIFALNEARLQPGGGTLTDPNRIYPGWVLLLPSMQSPAPQPMAPASNGSTPASTSATPTTTSDPATSAPTVDPSVSSGGHRAVIEKARRTYRTARRLGSRRPPVSADGVQQRLASRPVVLPSGSVIAPTFAAGVLTAVAVGRLRRRRRYSPRDPQPGRDLRTPLLAPALRNLTRPSRGPSPLDEDPDEASDVRTTPEPGVAAASSLPRLPLDPARPGQLEIGARGDVPVILDLEPMGGLGLRGPESDEILRAWCATLLAALPAGTSEILTTKRRASDLFPGLAPTSGLRTVRDPETLLQAVETEIVSRSRRLAEADQPDASTYRARCPEDPLPFLMVVASLQDPELEARWKLACDAAPRLSIVVLSSEALLTASAITLDGYRTAVSASPHELADRVQSATLFSLTPDDAVQLIDAVTEATSEEESLTDEQTSWSETPPSAVRAEEWPVVDSAVTKTASPAIFVRLLGPYRITVDGTEITKGLRTAAKELLAWYLLRPEGASAAAAVDALWPDTPPDLVAKRFWRALGNLRTALCAPGSSERPEVLIRSGDNYRPRVDELDCDVWQFQSHLRQAVDSDENERGEALQAAADAYCGDLASGADYLWIEPAREDLRQRALDALVRLAESDESSGRYEPAVADLERAVEIDPYAEELYRRLMVLQERRGRPDAVLTTWRRLQRSLAELGLDPDPVTVGLYRLLVIDRHSTDVAS